MNHYGPRQLQAGGWHYTCRNDDAVWPVGDCANHAAHSTREEACQCYRAYQLSRATLDMVFGNWGDCAVCGAPAKTGADMRDGWTQHRLCATHLTMEDVARLTPVPDTSMSS